MALDAVRELKTVSELAALHKVHPSQVTAWKKQLLEGAGTLFEGPASKVDKSDEPTSAELYEQIGRLKIELDWIKKKWPSTVDEKRSWVAPSDPDLSVRRQCELLGLHRSNLYYEAVPESEECLRRPFLGSRRMEPYLEGLRHEISRKKVQRVPRSGATDISPQAGSQDLSVPAARDRDHQTESGVGL